MTNFIKLADDFFVAPQISVEDIEEAKAAGIGLIINNRPDNEETSQPAGASIEEAALKAGLNYTHIPVGPMGISHAHLDQFDDATFRNNGITLAYCRSGTRSAIVHAMARARSGTPIDEIITAAKNAGYDLSGQRGTLVALVR